MLRIYFCCALAVSFASCNRTSYKAEIQTIDSLLVELDSAKAIFNRIDTSGFADLNRSMGTKTSYISGHYSQKGDTIGRDLAFLLSNYRDMRKPLKNHKMAFDEVAEELQFSREQLLNLRNDLENNLQDTIRVRKFMQQEVEAASEVIARPAVLAAGAERTRSNQAIYEPKIDSVIAVLKGQ